VNDKYLVKLLGGISSKQVFMLSWVVISLFFAVLMIAGYRKANRRNFRGLREPRRPPVRVDSRQIPGGGRNVPVKRD